MGIKLPDTVPHSASSLLNRLLARGKFRHVQILLKLAELGSVQRTAAAIGMSQSSVTQSLAYLEELLETQLFERHVRGVRPTPACTDLLPVARHLMTGVTESAEVIAARHNQGQGSIRLMASSAATSGMLLRWLPKFSERFPAIQIHLSEGEGEDQLLAVSRGEVDLVACRRRGVVPEGWQFRPLLEDRLAVVCAAGHPLAKARKASWSALARQTWLLAPANSLAREGFDELVERCMPQSPPTYPLVSRSAAFIGSLLAEHRVLALMPLSVLQHLVAGGQIVELQVGEAMPIEALGLLEPVAGASQAAGQLSAFLREAL